MGKIRSVPFSVAGVALSAALALAVTFSAGEVAAQGRGGKPSAASGGHGGWSGGAGGGRGSWHGGSERGRGGWNGGSNGRGSFNVNRGDHGSGWHGGHHHRGWRGGHHHRGWYGGRYYYPGWALGLGLGIGLTYPWWGWGAWPADYVVYDRVVEPLPERPVGVVIDWDGPRSRPAAAYRWYCPSPAGYHPEVPDCPAGWMKVLPPDAGAPSPSAPAGPGAPRSNAPSYDPEPASPGGAPVLGGPVPATRIAAPRMTPPLQVDHPAASGALAAAVPR